jgi:hypothetical protein
MGVRMEEPDAEGLAPHGGPGPCVDVPRGRGEAWVGVRVGRAIEPRNHSVRGADAVTEAEGDTVDGVMRESSTGPARSENQGMHVTLHTREPGDPTFARPVDHRVGRSGNAVAVA